MSAPSPVPAALAAASTVEAVIAAGGLTELPADVRCFMSGMCKAVRAAAHRIASLEAENEALRGMLCSPSEVRH